jgi:hypothetical protein
VTILNFRLSERAVCILTDTLLRDADQGDAPAAFATKVFRLPQMRRLITGTGLVPFIHGWSTIVNGAIVAADMRDLDKIAPRVLPDLFAKHRGDDVRALNTTIYHFGFDRKRERFVGFRYRSAGGFRSKRLPYGISTYPVVNREMERKPEARFPRDFIRCAQMQKEELDRQREAPVGGQLVAFQMRLAPARDGVEVVTGISVCHEFADYQAMLARLATPVPRLHNTV